MPSGITPRVVRGVGAGVWLAYLVISLPAATGHGHSALYTAGDIALTAAFAAAWLALIVIWAGPQRSAGPRGAVPVVAVLFVIAVAASVIYGAAGIWIFVSSAACWTVRDQRRALRVLALATACYVILGLTSHLHTENFLLNLLSLVLVGGAVIGFRRRMELMRELIQAREAVARLAANEERLRLARDLHDLTGQSLSMITLKSELAARLVRRLPEGGDRDQALDEIGQVASVSRQTLHDIREAVSGYRRPTLAVEVITARTALETAGIMPHDDPEITLLSGTFDPDTEAALAWCLREAVTNVVRHSRAANCHITLSRRADTLLLEVRDDGRGPGGDGTVKHGGTGLRGMSERLSAVGGHLRLRPDSQGFCLTASVPVRSGATVAV
jgi:two-component system sensor histidine kinase DesK